MAEALVAGAALGAPFGELLSAVIAVTKKTAKFKSILKRLESTLNFLHPQVLEISKLDKQLDHSNQETILFIAQLEQGITLIRTCASIPRWNLYRKFSYSNKLIKLESTISAFFGVKEQAQLGSISRKTLVGVQNLESKTDRIFSMISNQAGFSGLCSAPELPDHAIGLDVQVAVSKGLLLKDDVSTVVLSAPGGCGKTTLAKMLCDDHEIRGVSHCNIFKNRLQEFAQKQGFITPVYHISKEGPSHQPSFRSTVVVNNVKYDSLTGFSNRKAAEQSAAEVALLELESAGATQASLLVHETGLCKNLLQEYAQKMNFAIPFYESKKVDKQGRDALYTSSVDVGGIKYIGGVAKTKKHAELEAARTALLAIESAGPELELKQIDASSAHGLDQKLDGSIREPMEAKEVLVSCD